MSFKLKSKVILFKPFWLFRPIAMCLLTCRQKAEELDNSTRLHIVWLDMNYNSTRNNIQFPFKSEVKKNVERCVPTRYNPNWRNTLVLPSLSLRLHFFSFFPSKCFNPSGLHPSNRPLKKEEKKKRLDARCSLWHLHYKAVVAAWRLWAPTSVGLRLYRTAGFRRDWWFKANFSLVNRHSRFFLLILHHLSFL